MTLTGLTGRGTEMARLRAAIDKARTGRPVTLLVRGEPGIGKSAVLEALSVLAADTGFEVAVARTRAYPDSPFAAADHLLGRLLSAGAPATPSTDRPALLEHLRHLVDLVRTHAHRSPVVLCLDDVADADPWSLRWLLALAGSAYPTQVVIALSADDFGVGHEPPGGARLTALAEHIDLTGLPHGSTQRLRGGPLRGRTRRELRFRLSRVDRGQPQPGSGSAVGPHRPRPDRWRAARHGGFRGAPGDRTLAGRAEPTRTRTGEGGRRARHRRGDRPGRRPRPADRQRHAVRAGRTVRPLPVGQPHAMRPSVTRYWPRWSSAGSRSAPAPPCTCGRPRFCATGTSARPPSPGSWSRPGRSA